MTRMKRPTIVGNCYEWPFLWWQSNLDRVLLDVPNRPPHIVRMVEKNLPSPAAGPRPLETPATFSLLKKQMTCALEIDNHLFRQMFMFSDQQVEMVRHDRACVTGIPAVAEDIANCLGNRVDL